MSGTSLVSDPAKLILAAPLVFGIHVLEEAPGFVRWFNSVVERGISQPLFIEVNATAFLITLVVAGIFAGTRTLTAARVAVAWLGFLMFANAIFHVTGAIVHREYVPGTVTAAVAGDRYTEVRDDTTCDARSGVPENGENEQSPGIGPGSSLKDSRVAAREDTLANGARLLCWCD